MKDLVSELNLDSSTSGISHPATPDAFALDRMVAVPARGALVVIRTSRILPTLAVPGAARHGVCRAGLAAGLPFFILVLHRPTAGMTLAITLAVVTAIARGALVVIRTSILRAAFIVP